MHGSEGFPSPDQGPIDRHSEHVEARVHTKKTADAVKPKADESTPLLSGSSSSTSSRSLQDRIRDSFFNKHVGVVCFTIGMFVVGVAFLVSSEQWSTVSSAYVVVQIITTIGYGDFTVATNGAKLFIAFYSLACLILFAYYANLFRQWVVNIHTDYVRQRVKLMCQQSDEGDQVKLTVIQRSFYASSQASVAFMLAALMIAFGTIYYRLAEHCTCSYGEYELASSGCKDPDFATCIATGGYVKTWVDTFYMSVITLTTIGFGDYVPRTHQGRCVAIVWMFIGVALKFNFIDKVSKWFFGLEAERSFELAEEVRHEENSNIGSLTRGEFLTFILLQNGMVSKDLLHEIDLLYDKMGGSDSEGVSYGTIRCWQMKAGLGKSMETPESPTPTPRRNRRSPWRVRRGAEDVLHTAFNP